MSYRVLIRAFTLRRDLSTSYLVKGYLETKNCEVRISSVREFNFFLKYWQPHLVIINTVGVIKNVHNINPKCLIVHWPGEGAEDDNTCDAALLKNNLEAFERLDLILAWGKLGKNQFIKTFKKEKCSKVIVTGNPRLDLVKFLDKKNQSKNLGFICRFNSLNHASGQSTLFSLRNAKISNYESIISQMDGFMLMMEAYYFALKKTSHNISIRPHPLESVTRYKKDVFNDNLKGRVSIDESLDLSEWIASLKCSITPLSSSFIEHYLLKVPMICTDAISGNIDYIKSIQPTTALGIEVSNVPKNKHDLFDMLEQKDIMKPKKNDKIEELLTYAHNFNKNVSAVKAGCDQILNLLKKRAPNLTPKFNKKICDAIDYLRVFKSIKSNSYHLEINYSPFHHKMSSLIKQKLNFLIKMR